VLNALGLSIKIWSRLLSGEHDYRVIVPVLPSCDPLAGGMTETQSARELASTLADLLDDLALPEVDVIGWCNAGRVGIELFRLSHPSLAKLVLLSPTFRGGLTRSGGTSPWEDNLDKLFSMVADVPSRAAYVSTMMRLPQPAPDWEQLADQPIQRVRQLFSMPRKAFDTALIKPMATPESLVHYVRRTYLDQALSAEPPAPLPGDRIVLIQGSHDSIVDNVHTREWLGDRAPGFTCYEVSGAGHYIQDLQYPYLVHLLHRVLVPGSEVGCLPTRVREISQACP
jgi:pimeloyl-ACP methyl ester carboxylesterase